MGPAAARAVLGVPYEERADLAKALRTELLNGPNASKEVWFDAPTCRYPDDSGVYKATPLSSGYLVIFRSMTDDELRRLGREKHRRVRTMGLVLMDILHPVSAFTRGPRLVERP